jgi:hypothetical protein
MEIKMENKKRKFKWYLSCIVLVVATGLFLMFFSFWSQMVYTINNVQGIWVSIIASIIRIIILAVMSAILFVKWFKQEAIYTSDAFFLFAMFFLILTIGKLYDLPYNLILVSGIIDDTSLLLLLKIRHFIVALNIIPMLYIGLQATMTLLSVYVKELSKSQFNKIRLWIVLIFLIIVSTIIIIAPEIDFLISALPYYTFPIFIAIGIMFLFMYINKHLSQANGLIIGIAFFLFIVSNLFRSFASKLAMSEPSLYIVIEGFDIIVNFLMFIGFIRKPKYAV